MSVHIFILRLFRLILPDTISSKYYIDFLFIDRNKLIHICTVGHGSEKKGAPVEK